MNFTSEELNRKTKIILYYSEKKDIVFEEEKAYFKKFPERRILDLGILEKIATINHYVVQTLSRNSMRSVKINDLPENERLNAILTTKGYFKSGLIAISDDVFSLLNAENSKLFLEEKNGVDILVHHSKIRPLIDSEIIKFAEETNREIWFAVNYTKEYKITDSNSKFQTIINTLSKVSVREKKTVYYNPQRQQLYPIVQLEPKEYETLNF